MAPSQSLHVPLRLFYSYSHRDKELQRELREALSPLRRQGRIFDWHDGMIEPGAEWQRAIDEKLEAADIILLLISPSFIASDFTYLVEMGRALERHRQNTARAIPILVRPTDWEDEPFAKLQILPTGVEPVTRWGETDYHRDDAWLDVVRGIRRVADSLIAEWVKDLGDAIGDAEEVTSPQKTVCFVQRFEHGQFIWTADGTHHILWGPVCDEYMRLGGVEGGLGFPVKAMDRAESPAGKAQGTYQRFEGEWVYPPDVLPPDLKYGATIYCTGKYGAFATSAGIGLAYERSGGTNGPLGFPTSIERTASPSPYGTEGSCQEFEGGILHWCERYGVASVGGPILELYRRLNGSGGILGFPATPENEDLRSGTSWNRIQLFEGGVVVVTRDRATAIIGEGARTIAGNLPDIQENLLDNPSFEERAHGWMPIYLPEEVKYSVQHVPSRPRYGSGALRLSSTQDGASVGRDLSMEVLPGSAYSFTVWARVPDDAPIPFRVSVALWALDGERESVSTTEDVGHQWVRITTPLTVSHADHTGLRAELYLHTVGSFIDIDEASLVKTD